MTPFPKVSSRTPFAGAVLLAILSFACETPAEGPGDAAPRTDATSVDAPSLDGGSDGRSDGGSDSVSPPRAPTEARLALAVGCSSNTECASGFCVDGVCCDVACDGACRSCSLTGKVGTCSPVVDVQDDACGGDSTCDATGQCRKQLGNACDSSSDCASGNCVDGVCCGSASCGTCQSCTAPGSVGTCAPVAKFTEDPDSSCSGASSCNGLGACQLKNGEACSAATDCVSQQCVDSVCCESACDGTCYSCNQEGSLGQCKPLDGAEDLSATVTCQGETMCSTLTGGASCKLKAGMPCTANDQCANGSCLTSYQDLDSDGWGNDSRAVQLCELAPQPGYVLRGGDCCEIDPHAHPGVTAFSNVWDECNSYDWNCDGREESTTTCTSYGSNVSCVSNGSR